MHKNIERIISLALLGAINSNNAIALASEVNSEEIMKNVENNESSYEAESSTDKTVQETKVEDSVSIENGLKEEIMTDDIVSDHTTNNTLDSDENKEIKDVDSKEEETSEKANDKDEPKDVNLLENKNIEDVGNKYDLTDKLQGIEHTVNGETLEITLNEGESIPDLTGLNENYTTLIIKTNGDKGLSKTDFDNIRKSKIPNIDLSSSYAESIPANAFSNCSFLQTFKFPNGINSIENSAFSQCSNLQGNLIIPDTVTTIGNSAFSGCSKLTGNLNLPDVTSIGNSAFYGCSGFTGNLVVPSSVKIIGEYTFQNCSGFDGKLILPQNLEIIKKYAFLGCRNLSGNLIIPNSVTNIGSCAFYSCHGFTGDLVIPESVTTIGSSAFSNCSGFDGKLALPESITSINDGVFFGCSGLSGELIIPNSITSIGSSAFGGCSGFTGDLVIPNSVTEIGGYAFSKCTGFTGELKLSNSLITISNYAFEKCSGLSGKLVIPDSLKTIGMSAFYQCSGFTGDLIIPDSVTEISKMAFSQCSGFNGNLVLSNSIKIIDENVFYECSGFKGDLIIPNSVTSINYGAFRYCSGFKGDLIIPDSVTEIGSYAFNNCTGFNGILRLPESLNSIKKYAFSNCYNLTGTLRVPNSVTTIEDYTFNNCNKLVGDLIIPDSVTTIGVNAFYNCSGFNGTLSLPSTLKSIGEKAFYDCENLIGNLVIPNTVTSIGNSAFSNCSKITGDLIIDDTITYLGKSAFAGCSSLNINLKVNPSTYKSNNYNISENMAFLKNIIICVKSEYEESNYGKEIFDELISLDRNKIEIEVPYNFDIEKTWLKDYMDMIKIPTLSIIDESILDEENNEIYTSEATLKIPNLDNESDIKIKKDSEDYPLPNKNDDGSYTFKEPGLYNVKAKTKFGTVSNINFEVESFYGSTTINYIDEETGAIIDSETIDNLKMGEYEYNSKEIDGYDINDDLFKIVTINRENRNQEIEFKYLKTIKGSVNIKYIDGETDEELVPSEFLENLSLKEYTYKAKSIDGYDLIGEESVSIELTRESPNKTIEFRYTKKIENIQSDTIVAEKEDILNAIKNKEDLKIIGSNGALKIYKNTLTKIKDLIENITFTMRDGKLKDIKAMSLLEKESLNIIDIFSVHTNLAELKDNHIVNVSREINNFDNKTLYLYKVNNKSKNASLQYIGEVKTIEGFISFNIGSKLLDGSEFIVSTNKLNSDNTTDDSTNSDNIPSLGGLNKTLSILSISSILSGIYVTSRRKK